MTTPPHYLLGNPKLPKQVKEAVDELCSCCICPLPGCLCTPHCLLLEDSAANQEDEVSRFAEGESGQERAISMWSVTSSLIHILQFALPMIKNKTEHGMEYCFACWMSYGPYY